MVKYLCTTCFYVGTNRESFKKLDTVKPVLELLVPEMKSTSTNGYSALVCEQCFFFVKTVEQFIKRCTESQRKISELNIEDLMEKGATIGQVHSTTAPTLPVRKILKSCSPRASVKEAQPQSLSPEKSVEIDDDNDGYYVTRQDLVAAGILIEIPNTSGPTEPAAKKKKPAEDSPSWKAPSPDSKPKCSRCATGCSPNRQGKPARCDYCSFTSMEKASLLKHYNACHQELVTSGGLVACSQCSFQCSSLIQLSVHRVKQHEEPATCSLGAAVQKADLEEHYCGECVTIFLTAENYEEHMVEEHDRAVCSCCQQLFTQ